MVTEYSIIDAKDKLDELLDLSLSNHIPIKITRNNASNGYIISEEDFESMEETRYLLSNSINANHLRKSLSEIEKVKFNSVKDLKREIGI